MDFVGCNVTNVFKRIDWDVVLQNLAYHTEVCVNLKNMFYNFSLRYAQVVIALILIIYITHLITIYLGMCSKWKILTMIQSCAIRERKFILQEWTTKNDNQVLSELFLLQWFMVALILKMIIQYSSIRFIDHFWVKPTLYSKSQLFCYTTIIFFNNYSYS